MEVLRGTAQLQNYLQKFQIDRTVSDPALSFRLVRYRRGECLTAPFAPTRNILYLVKGAVQIYHLGPDCNPVPVAPAYPGTVFGDVEFATGQPPAYYAEALQETLCVALSLSRYEDQLRKDPVFLNAMLRSVGGKLDVFSHMEASAQGLEEHLLYYLEHICAGGKMESVNSAVLQLHCSRRQLQRVLKRLCETGQIKKIGRGAYQLVSSRSASTD